ncbi:hypothetical protein ACFL1M_02890 [Patescibacteria group bacterium]
MSSNNYTKSDIFTPVNLDGFDIAEAAGYPSALSYVATLNVDGKEVSIQVKPHELREAMGLQGRFAGAEVTNLLQEVETLDEASAQKPTAISSLDAFKSDFQHLCTDTR